MTSLHRVLRLAVAAGVVALAGCGGSQEPGPAAAEVALGKGEALRLPVRASALFEAGDLDRDGADDLVLAAGRDHRLLAWTSRRGALTALTGAKLSDSEAGSYPVAARGLVLTGARLRWVAARRTWPAAVKPVVLDATLYRQQGAAAGGDVLAVDVRGRARLVRTGAGRRPPAVRSTSLKVDGPVGSRLRELAFARGHENWLLRAGSPRRLADSAGNEFAQLIAPFGDRALTVVLRETDGLPDRPRTQRLAARLVDERSAIDTRSLDGATIDPASRATRYGLAVIDAANRRVTLLDVRDGRIRARAIRNCIGIAAKDDGVALLRPNGTVELVPGL